MNEESTGLLVHRYHNGDEDENVGRCVEFEVIWQQKGRRERERKMAKKDKRGLVSERSSV